MVSTLGKAVDFFREFGLFDVVLPFLLVFSVVFAILEKTKVLGEEDGVPKRTLNSMIAFTVAMFVIAANKIVNVINTALPNIVLLTIFIVMFLMLVGILFKDGQLDFATKWQGATAGFAIVILIAVILIFLDSIKLDSNESWLGYAWTYLITNASGAVVGSIFFAIITILGVMWITGSVKSKNKDETEGDET